MLRVRSLVIGVLLMAGLLVGPFQAGAPSAAAQTGVDPMTPDYSLGQPGTSYRYVQSLGVSEEAYPADTIHLNRPYGLFIDGANNLYVVEEQGQRLLKYDSSKNNLLSIGIAGTCYTADDAFCNIKDVTVDSAGNIWVVDYHRVVKYDSGGNFVLQFPEHEAWASGDDNGHFNGPSGIAVDSSNRLFVSDGWNHRIQVFDISSGSPVYLATIGVPGVSGSDNSHFNQPQRIAVDSSSRLYVMDTENNRVQRCTFAGVWGCTTFFSDLGWSQGIAIGPADEVFIADNAGNAIYQCTPAGVCSDFATSTVGYYDVAVDSSGNVYAAASYEAVVEKYNSSGVDQGVYLGVLFVPYVTDNYHYNYPRLEVDKDGNLLILEEVGHRLNKLSPQGTPLWSFGVPGVDAWDNQHLNYPNGLDSDAQGNIYVADGQRVQVFTPGGVYSKTLSGSGDFQFYWANGVSIGPDGKIYVSDGPRHRVTIYDQNLGFIGQIGETDAPGSDTSHFRYPLDVEVDAQGNLYVADGENCRVQKFNSSLVYQLTFGSGNCDDELESASAEDVAVDAKGRVFIAGWNNRVQVFDAAGAYLTTIGGSWGTGSSQFRSNPSVAVDAAGNVYAADGNNHRVQKFSLGVPGWKQVNINGFGRRSAEWIPSLEVFQNQLYAGTGNWQFGAQVWRLESDGQWLAASEFGFSSTYTNTNAVVLDMIVFEDQLYASTGWGGATGQVWRTPDGANWQPVTTDGFNDAENIAITSFAEYNGRLYVGTGNPTGGAQIWRSDSGAPGSWDKVAPEAAGSAGTANVTGFAAFNGQLYAAVESENPGQVWRSPDGSDWTVMVDDGFGDPKNTSTGGFAVFNNNLYLGVRNDTTGGQIWKTDGTTWAQAVGDGFGDPQNGKVESLNTFEDALYAVANNGSGMQVWRTSDGAHWVQIGPDGFGDSNNNTTLWSNGTVVFRDNLFIGTYNNANGAEVWQLLDDRLFFPLLGRNR